MLNKNNILYLLVTFLICCGSGDGIISSDSTDTIQSYDFVLNISLHKDTNGYYHFPMNNYASNTSQALTKFTAHTNNPNIQFVWWDCDTQWEYTYLGQMFDVDIINHSSYTNDDGDAFTMFGPFVDMAIDTVTVWCGYQDSETDITYVKDIKIILE